MKCLSESEVSLLGLIQGFVGLDCLQIHLETGANYWAVTGLEPIAAPFHSLLSQSDAQEGRSPEQHLIGSILKLGRAQLESISLNRWKGNGQLAGSWCLLDSNPVVPGKPRAAALGAGWTLWIQFRDQAPAVAVGLLAERTMVCPATVYLNAVAVNDFATSPARRGQAASSTMPVTLSRLGSKLRRWYSTGPIGEILTGIRDYTKILGTGSQPRYCRGYPLVFGVALAEFCLKGRAGLDDDRGRLGLRSSGRAMFERGGGAGWFKPWSPYGWSSLARFYIDSPFGLERGFDAKGATAFGNVLAGHALIVLTQRTGPSRIWPVQMGVALEPILLDEVESGLEIFHCAHHLPENHLRLESGPLLELWLTSVQMCLTDSLRHVADLKRLKAATSQLNYRPLFLLLSACCAAKYPIALLPTLLAGVVLDLILRRLVLVVSVKRALKERRFV